MCISNLHFQFQVSDSLSEQFNSVHSLINLDLQIVNWINEVIINLTSTMMANSVEIDVCGGGGGGWRILQYSFAINIIGSKLV